MATNARSALSPDPLVQEKPGESAAWARLSSVTAALGVGTKSWLAARIANRGATRENFGQE